MRNQYKVLTEKYEQVAEAAPALTMDTIISVLAKETEDWTNYTDMGDEPDDISYRGFIDFVISSPHLNRKVKAAWNAMTPRNKRKTYNLVIDELKIKNNLEENIDLVALKTLNYNKKLLKVFTAWLFSKWNTPNPAYSILQDWFESRVSEYRQKQPGKNAKDLAYQLLLSEIKNWKEDYSKAQKAYKQGTRSTGGEWDIEGLT